MTNLYTIEYFLKDPEFIRWVRNPDSDSSAFWYSFAKQHPETRQKMARAAEIIRALKVSHDYPDEAFKEEVLNNIISEIGASALKLHKSKGKHRSIFKTMWQYAAVFLIAFGIVYAVYHYYSSGERIVTQNHVASHNFIKESSLGTKIQTKLPDGTRIWLNSGSRIEYYEDSLHNTRNVMLEGEVFFEVFKNPSKPFIVKTHAITVEALGTSFNVRAYKDRLHLEVALLTGKVIVSKLKETHYPLELHPGEKAVIDNSIDEITKQSFDYVQDFGWMEGILFFDHADFEMVKEKLERWYGVRIIVSDEEIFSNWKVDGQFENQSLEMVLTHLSYTKDFDFLIIGKEVYLKKK